MLDLEPIKRLLEDIHSKNDNVRWRANHLFFMEGVEDRTRALIAEVERLRLELEEAWDPLNEPFH